MKAGEDYLAALKALGLRPMFLGWGEEIASKQWLLVMITSIVDAGGPLALNKLLFRAYNAEATPKTISPFIVRVYSPDIVPADFYSMADTDVKITPPNIGISINFRVKFDGVEYEMINSYIRPPKQKPVKTRYHANLNDWQKFKRNVEKLVA